MGYYFCPFVFGATIVFAVFFLIFMKALNVNFKDLFRRKVKPTNVTEGDQYLNIGVSRPSVVRTKIRMVMFFSDHLASKYRSFKSIIMIRYRSWEFQFDLIINPRGKISPFAIKLLKTIYIAGWWSRSVFRLFHILSEILPVFTFSALTSLGKLKKCKTVQFS